jgi:RHS repeat-associated protein
MEAGTTRYFLSDRVSTRVVLDMAGNVVGRRGHLPFGEQIGTNGEQDKHHFTSYERDSENATDYAVNRQYATGIAKFMRVDPMTGSPSSPQSLNRYTYVRNDPILKLDPLGLSPECWLEDGCLVCYNPETEQSTRSCPDASVDLPSIGGDWAPYPIEPTPVPPPEPPRKKAKFSLAKLKECIRDLTGAELRSFNSGDRAQIYGPNYIDNDGNNSLYTVTFSFLNSGAAIAQMTSNPYDTWVYGVHFGTHPYVVWIANDIAAHTGNSNQILTIATQVHELMHAIALVGRVAGWNDDNLEQGDKMEVAFFLGLL